MEVFTDCATEPIYHVVKFVSIARESKYAVVPEPWVKHRHSTSNLAVVVYPDNEVWEEYVMLNEPPAKNWKKSVCEILFSNESYCSALLFFIDLTEGSEAPNPTDEVTKEVKESLTTEPTDEANSRPTDGTQVEKDKEN